MSRPVPPHIRDRQSQASDPARSAWVAANAGSGKTFVLAQRVIRLLLRRTPPAKLLCLTFTKAAAANMSARVFDILADWTRFDDQRLFAELEATTGVRPRPDDLAYARQLFARTVETPGGLKIQTIHAFCEGLLHVFPFEANVAARFEVVQDLREADMLAAARAAVLAAAMPGRDRTLGEAIGILEEEAGAAGFDTILRECIGKRRHLRELDLRSHAEALRRALGLDAGMEDDAGIDAQIIGGGIAPDRWAAVARTIGETTTTGKALLAAAQLHDPSAKAEAYVEVFLTDKGTPRKTVMIKQAREAHPQLAEEFDAERVRVPALVQRRLATGTLRRTRALLLVAGAVIDRYERAKATQGLLDFDDLIDKTLTLLRRSSAAWVMYKLDAGIDHILVDEAQDTSPEQWEILKRLAADFTAGDGARAAKRTFFAVGDEKQSIYSFQGAAPEMFAEMHRWFDRRIRDAAAPPDAGVGHEGLAYVRLPLSFRSAPSVLEAVDLVFAGDSFDGLSFEEGVTRTVHEAWKVGLPGRIEIWPTVEKREIADPTDWSLPLDQLGRHDPAVVLADRVAGAVRGWIAPGAPERVHDHEGRPRPVRAGDVLVLVRTRGAIFEATIRALKRRGVPVAGADRMVLTAHIAVMDLVAAGRAALLRGDDLALACVAKSPLLGLTDDDLIRLAATRGTRALADMIDADPACADIAATLAEWRAWALNLAPFDFYMRLLGTDGRKRFAARLGPEADDAIDEFLRRALDHEHEGAPSLPLFLAAMDAASQLEIKRDMEAVGDSVRVMTVHAAKGLESKIVVLADTCSLPDGRLDPKIFRLRPAGAAEGAPQLFAWSARKADDPPDVAVARADMRAKAMQEYRRLLYVAMTRAEEHLVVAGIEGRRRKDGSSTRPTDCWYSMIEAALGSVLRDVPAPWDAAETMRVSGGMADAVAVAVPSAEVDRTEVLPAWALRPAVREPAAVPPLRPSNTLAAADTVPSSPSRSWGDPRTRHVGRLVHTLLQRLPDVPQESRGAIAARFAAAHAGTLEAGKARALVASVLGVLDDPTLAPLFGPQSRAEVAVAGNLARADGTAVAVSGQIDRLAVLPEGIWLADFKTGAAPAGEPPRAYVEQLAVYGALVGPLYPERPLRALLVWTDGPDIVELAPPMLDGALRRVLGPREDRRRRVA